VTGDETALHTHNLKVAGNPDVSQNTPTPSSSVVLTKVTAQTSTGQPIPGFWIYNNTPPVTADQQMNAASIGNPPGSGQPHANLMPYLTLSACIALDGVFPSRS
jgi:microcystin-dependent protein